MEKLIFVAIGLVFGSIAAWYFSNKKYQDENIDLEEIEEKFNLYEKTIEELTARIQHQEELGLEKDQSITEFRTKYTQVQDSYEIGRNHYHNILFNSRFRLRDQIYKNRKDQWRQSDTSGNHQ